jgi:hypothetical protein
LPNKKLFHEYLSLQNLREGAWVDGKMVSVYADLLIGPFTLRGVSYQWATGSIRLNQRKSLTLKPSYIHIIVDLFKAAIKEKRNVKATSNEAEPSES